MPTVLTPAFGSRSSSSFAWEMLFAGYRWDSENGLYHIRNRWLTSHLGVWIERDPLGLSAGIDLYEYSGSNSVRFTDPTGEAWPVISIIVAVGAVAAACIFSQFSFLTADFFLGVWRNVAWARCVGFCRTAKLCGINMSMIAALEVELLALALDLCRLAPGAFQWRFVAADFDGFECAGIESIIPFLGVVTTLIGARESCLDCCDVKHRRR